MNWARILAYVTVEFAKRVKNVKLCQPAVVSAKSTRNWEFEPKISSENPV